MSERPKPGKQSAVVLMSGGIDSMACAHFLRKDARVKVAGLFVDFGQAARLQESRAVSAIAARMKLALTSARIASKRRYASGEIVGRNLFLTSAALLLSDPTPDIIATGIHGGTPYYDCSSRFVDRLRQLMEEETNGTSTITAPFLEWSKGDVVAYCRKHRLPLDLTYSCESGRRRPCGTCLSCLDRKALDAGG